MSSPTHWLMFNEKREVVGCHCGMEADPEDEGYGDSVVDHLLVAEMDEYREIWKLRRREFDEQVHQSLLDDLDDWIKSIHDFPVRRFNPLRVPLSVTHTREDWWA